MCARFLSFADAINRVFSTVVKNSPSFPAFSFCSKKISHIFFSACCAAEGDGAFIVNERERYSLHSGFPSKCVEFCFTSSIQPDIVDMLADTEAEFFVLPKNAEKLPHKAALLID